jgi:hypothetical protein
MFFAASSTVGSSKDTPDSVSLGFLARIQLAVLYQVARTASATLQPSSWRLLVSI